MQDRIAKLYDEMSKIEDEISTVTMRIENLQKNKLSEESVYRILLSFDKLYSGFTDLEKKKFPIYYGGVETEQIDFDWGE